jgi:hypothetical protein
MNTVGTGSFDHSEQKIPHFRVLHGVDEGQRQQEERVDQQVLDVRLGLIR